MSDQQKFFEESYMQPLEAAIRRLRDEIGVRDDRAFPGNFTGYLDSAIVELGRAVSSLLVHDWRNPPTPSEGEK
jgi:hypothetical protein